MRVEVDISSEDLEIIQGFISINQSEKSEVSSHGALDINTLTQMLLQDVALARRRPGSWEGANMIQVLESHGYKT